MTSLEPLVTVRQQLAVLLTCLVAALACSGAVTMPALLTYVLPGCLVVGLVGMWLSRTIGSGAATSLAVLVALAIAEMTNVTSGDTSGPVARSTFLAASGTAVAVVLARRAAPLLVATPVGGVLGAALWLGAADEVVPVLGVVVALMVLVLPSLARSERREASVRRRVVVPVVAMLTVTAAIAADRLQDALATGSPVVFEAAQVNPGITPPGVGESEAAASSTSPTGSPTTVTRPKPDVPRPVWWVVTLGGVVLLLLGVLVRVLWVALRSRRRRLRLRQGDPITSTLGAWHWTLDRLRAHGVAVPDTVPPDEVASGRHRLGLPDEPLRRVRLLAGRAALACFSAHRRPSRDDAEEAWLLGSYVVNAARKSLPRHVRVLGRLR